VVSAVEEGRAATPESPPPSVKALPDGLTASGLAAYRDVQEEFRDRLWAELRRRGRGDLTAGDVYQAVGTIAEAMHRAQPPDRTVGGGVAADGRTALRHTGSPRALGSGLIAAGSAGAGLMQAYLHSVWQVGVLAAFVLILLAGVGLTWRGGDRVGTSGEPTE
jgi:hypothetical protein